jgi:hypothetical protein
MMLTMCVYTTNAPSADPYVCMFVWRYAMRIAFSAYLFWLGHFDPCSPSHIRC